MIRKRITYILILIISFGVFGQSELPLQLSDEKIKPLRTMLDGDLQANLERELKMNPKWKKLIAQKKMAVGLVDLSDPGNARFARVNGNHMMYAASLPKIAILLAAMDAIDKES